MSSFFLERLYHQLGRPAWFWPAVMLTLLALWMVGSSVLEDSHG